jgi:hypothetical protein
MSNSTFRSIRALGGFAAVLALVVLAIPARAADPVFPPGSRIGLVPPAGMVASYAFAGFADPGKNAAILITALPAAAYFQIEKTLDTEALKKQGISLEKREPMRLGSGKAFLLTGRQVADRERYRKWLLVAAVDNLTALVSVQIPEQDGSYPDRVVRAALATLSVRATVPEAEELGLLPFTVGDLAGFHVDDVLRGRALVLSDAAAGSPKDPSTDGTRETPQTLDAHLLLAAVPGGPTGPDDRANFARLAFNEIAGIREVHVTMSEPLRIGGQPGYQTMAEAKDAHTGTDVMVVQWLRFGSGGFLQMVGIARADTWTTVLSRLRTVRDSVEPK